MYVGVCARTHEISEKRISRDHREALSQDKREEILNYAVGETSVCVKVC